MHSASPAGCSALLCAASQLPLNAVAIGGSGRSPAPATAWQNAPVGAIMPEVRPCLPATGRVRARLWAGLSVDVGPLRRHAGFRRLWTGQLIASVGSQLTVVAVGYQTYRLTGSTAMVGLVSLGQLVPLLAGSLFGGPLVDAWDRRRVMMATQLLLAVGVTGLAVNSMLPHPLLWPLFACTAESAAFQGVDWAARRASLRRLVPPADLAAALSVQSAALPDDPGGGPRRRRPAHRARRVQPRVLAERGLVRAGVPHRGAAAGAAAGRRAARQRRLADRRDPVPEVEPAAGRAFLIDLGAMVFGMPRALFPALATTVYGGGAATVGT